jgi:hypothetical protein
VVQPEGYRAAVRTLFLGRWPLVRISEEAGVVFLPGVLDNKLTLTACVPVSIRVQYVGEQGRPVLTWVCSCADFHVFQDQCKRSNVERYRNYPHRPRCVHKHAVSHHYGGPSSMLAALYDVP